METSEGVSEYLDRIAFPRLDRLTVFADLDPRRKGANIYMRCPSCNQRRAWIKADGFAANCNRKDECAWHASILAYLAKTDDSPRGDDFVKAAQRVCELAGVPFPEKSKDPQILAKISAAARKADALHTVLSVCRKELTDGINNAFADPGVAGCLEYLGSRNFRLDFVASEELGYLQDVDKLPIQQKEKIALGLAYEDGNPCLDWNNRLIGVLRDVTGRLRGLWGRALGESKQKYRWTLGVKVAAIGGLGLDVALQQSDEQIALEGNIDVLKLRQYGHRNVFAIAGSGVALNPERLTLLFDLGVRRLILFEDNDLAGGKGIDAAREAYDQARRSPELFVVDPLLLDPHKDPDEFIDAKGSQKFCEALTQAQHIYRYYARKLTEGIDATTDLGKSAAIQKALDYDAKINDPAKVHQLSVHFWTEICNATGSTVDEIKEIRDAWRARKQEHVLRTEAERVIVSMRNVLDSGNLKELPDVFNKANERLSVSISHSFDLRTAADDMDVAEQYMRRIGRSELIGAGIKSMPLLTKYTAGLRGLVLIAAQPNVGKTVTAMQMSLDVLTANPDWCVIYISLDMPWRELHARILSHISHLEYNRLRALYSEAGGTPDEFSQLERARYDYLRIAHRLAFIERGTMPVLNSTTMLRAGEALKAKTGAEHIMYVGDFVELLPVNEDRLTDREIEKKQIGECVIVRDAIGGDPFVGIVEIRKPAQRGTWAVGIEDVMGSARKAYSADVVLLINPLLDYELLTTFDTNGEWVYARNEPLEIEEAEIRKREHRKKALQIRENLIAKGRSLGTIEVAKVRDGGMRGRVPFTNFYRESRIQEGLHV